MSPPYRWYLDPLVSTRPLDEHVLAHHAGSGDTHLLAPFSDRLLSALPAEPPGCSLADLVADPHIADLGASEAEIANALTMLEDTGLVHPVTGE